MLMLSDHVKIHLSYLFEPSNSRKLSVLAIVTVLLQRLWLTSLSPDFGGVLGEILYFLFLFFYQNEVFPESPNTGSALNFG